MPGIELSRQQVGLRLAPRARPVDTSVADQVQLQGAANALNIFGSTALQIFKNKAKAAEIDASAKVELSQVEKRLELSKALENATDVVDADRITQEWKASLDQDWLSSVGDAEKRVFPGSKGDFRKRMDTAGQFNKLKMEQFADKSNKDITTKNLVDSISFGIDQGNYEQARLDTEAGKEMLGGPATLALNNKIDTGIRERNRQWAIALMESPPGTSVEEAGEKVAKGLSIIHSQQEEMGFTGGDMINFKNLAVSIKDRAKRNSELLIEVSKIQNTVKTNEVLNTAIPSTQDASDALQAAAEMEDSKDSKTRKLGKKQKERLQLSFKPNPVTNPKAHVESFGILGDFLAKGIKVDEFSDKLQESRYNQSNLSGEDFAGILEYGNLEIRPDLRDEVNAAIKSNTPQTKSSVFVRGHPETLPTKPTTKEYEIANETNKATLDWLSTTDMSKLQPGDISKTNAAIKDAIKYGKDPNEILARKQLRVWLKDGKITGDMMSTILRMKRKGVPMIDIMETEELRILGSEDGNP